MAYTPAVCDNQKCRAAWLVAVLSGAGELHVENCRAGYCPRCGSMGTVPDGIYASTGIGSTTFIPRSNADFVAMGRAVEFLNRVVAGEEPKAVAQEAQEKLPQYESLWKKLYDEKRDIIAFVTLFIAILTYLRGCSPANFATQPNKNPQEISMPKEVFDALLQSREASQPDKQAPLPRRTGKRKGRNRR